MILDIILLVAGIALVLWGADRFTDSASNVARRWNVSELVIGLTIVALGTSLPEFVVSVISSIQGSGDMSVGNIVGSNIFNTLVIVGMSAIVMPMIVSRGTLHREIPMSIGASILLLALCHDGNLDRWASIILIMCFSLFMGYTYYIAQHGKHKQDETTSAHQDTMGWGSIALWLTVGIGCLVGGGQMLVDRATDIALRLGMSERMVGLTILAAGTSLPELATSIVAARKGSAGLALGNALGSNLFNIYFVLGVCSMISPMQISGISILDWAVFVSSGILLFTVSLRKKISRVGGIVLTLGYLLYMSLLIMGQ